MRNFKQLKKYMKHNTGEAGWRNQYDDKIAGQKDGSINWPYLAGHYNSLLDDALSLIPPAFLEEMNNDEGDA